jgi:hypothetical protein
VHFEEFKILEKLKKEIFTAASAGAAEQPQLQSMRPRLKTL